jgi:signal transduction histidine kinase
VPDGIWWGGPLTPERLPAGEVEKGRELGLEQAALRRVATLVAEAVPLADLFGAVVGEVAQILAVSAVSLDRYETGGAMVVAAAFHAPAFSGGSRWPLDGPSVPANVFAAGRPARIDDHTGLDSTIAARVRGSGLRSAVGAPILVEAGAWGLIWVATTAAGPLPAGTESRLANFTELVAIAVSNAQSRDRLRRLADQQTSLRRVATLVAEGATLPQLLSVVAEEAARILDLSSVAVVRYEPDGTSVVVASFNDSSFPVGSRWPVDPDSLNAVVFETARPARIDDYSGLPGPIAVAARSSGVYAGVGVPIVVDGSVWGMIAAGRRATGESRPLFAGNYTGRMVLATEPLSEIEARLDAFTELVATSISRTQAQDDLRRLAEEQTSLRRVATLVAKAASPAEIFSAVVEEVGRILQLDRVEMVRYEPDGTATVIGASGDHPFAVGSQWKLDGPSVMASVFDTGRQARIDNYGGLPGMIAAAARDGGFQSAIGAPVTVDGRTWGAIIAISLDQEPIPGRSEVRLSQFTDLVATALSNATARDELIASRARIVTAGDEARRRIERDLHDGAQQRLLALGLDLQRVRASVPEDQRGTRSGLEQLEHDLELVLQEVREISRGLHPASLARVGLLRSLRALARGTPVPVEMDIDIVERPPEPIEIATYYAVSEVLTNAIKHSRASAISVHVKCDQTGLQATLSDDGVGGAVAGAGSGLTGLSDRVEALGGRFTIESPPGEGTTISIELPITRWPRS